MTGLPDARRGRNMARQRNRSRKERKLSPLQRVSASQKLVQVAQQWPKRLLQEEPEDPKKQHRPGEDESRQDVFPGERESPTPPQQGDRKWTQHHEKERQDDPRTLPVSGLHGRGSSFCADENRRTAPARRAGRRAATATIVVACVEHGVALKTDRFRKNGVVHGQNPSTPP